MAFCCEERLKQSQRGNNGRINYDTRRAVTAPETLCQVNMEVIVENRDEGSDFYIRDDYFICINCYFNTELGRYFLFSSRFYCQLFHPLEFPSGAIVGAKSQRRPGRTATNNTGRKVTLI